MCFYMDIEKRLEQKREFKTLQDLGYTFDPNGLLVDINTGEPFVCHSNEQFDLMSDLIISYGQTRLRTMCDEQTLDRSDTGPLCNIFTKNILSSSKLLVIIQNKGRERSGIWSCRQVMSVSLESGSMESYIQTAIKLNYGIIVTNPNYNYEIRNGRHIPITDSMTPEEHLFSVYKKFIANCPCQNILFFAVGSGSKALISLLKKQDELVKRIRAIALIDSTHTIGDFEGKNNLLDLFQKHSINWIASKEPFGTPLKDNSGSCFSGGHTQNTYCIPNAKNSVFEFYEQKTSFSQ